MAIDLTQNPYYNDFDPTKNYHQILFRPAYAVQSRELTQLQSILQNQVGSFAKNIFQNGSIVTGGSPTLECVTPQYICIEAIDPTGASVDVNNFIGKFVIDGDAAGIRAYVIAGLQATLTAPTVLVVKYTSGATMNVATTNPIQTEDGLFQVKILNSLSTPINFTDVTSGQKIGDSSVCSIQEGVFFIDGYFVAVPSQTTILDAFDNTPSYRIGLQVNDAIIDETQDASLLDPAQDSTNYQAPGATRYKYALTWTKRSLSSTDDTGFIEMIRVVNGILTKKVTTPLYSAINDTMARRMNDQSGSFTVRPFKMAFDPDAVYANAYQVVVEAGKAYVQGYEFETISPTYIKSERSRGTANVHRYNTTVDYENWLEVTNLVGPIPFNTLQSGTIHCVNTASIVVANAASAQNTAIGQIRFRALEYETGANGTSIQSAVWRGYAFDVNVAQSAIANCSGTGTANTFYLAPNFSPVQNAYAGMHFTITTHNGVSVNEHHSIGSYNGPLNLATLLGTETFAFGIPNSTTQFQLNYEFQSAESIVYANNIVNQHVFGTSMDVNSTSKTSVLVDPFQGAFLTDTNFNTAILQLPNSWTAPQSVVGGIPLSGSQYSGRKVYTAQNFSANQISFSSAAGITSAVNGSPLSGSDAIDNVLVVVRNATGALIANNQVINFASGNPNGNTVSVSSASNTSTWTITVPGMYSASQADVYVKVSLPYSDQVGSLLRTKTARIANVLSGLNSGGVQIPDANGLVQWYSQGGGTLGAQITIYANSAAWLNLKDATKTQSLFTSDVVALRKVIDVGQNLIADGNVQIAADITNNYTLDSGQRDNSYEHARIQLKSGTAGPSGNVVIYVDYLSHSGLGYLTVDSYASANIDYANIPSYLSATTGINYVLRDCIDFRPRRLDGDSSGVYGEELFGQSGQNFQTDFSYYLARKDKLVLNKDGTFEIIQGVPSLNPVPPVDKNDGMTLYQIILPPYTAKTTDIRQLFYDNRRYTMKDIGNLEGRISQLEYYSTLNQQETTAKATTVTDDFGNPRVQSGILVDTFKGHSVGAVLNADYHCAMDAAKQEMRPPFSLVALGLDMSMTDSTFFARSGSIITLPFTVQTLIDQPWAALAINVNPFNTITWVGNLKLDPTSDNWTDTTRAPDLHVDMTGDNDAYAALLQTVNAQGQAAGIFGTVWNNWQTTWKGASWAAPDSNWFGNNGTWYQNFGVYQQQGQVRTGIQTQVVPQTITKSIGDKVIDESLIPDMRSIGIVFVGKMFAPNTQVFPFFDDTAVSPYCQKAKVITVASATVQYQDTYQHGETVRVYDPAAGKNTATALVILNRNEPTYSNISVVNVTGGDDSNIANAYVVSSSNSTFLIGNITGANTRISGYYPWFGIVDTAIDGSHFILANETANSNVGLDNTTFVGESIFIAAGTGLGQSSTITAYDKNARKVTYSPAFSVVPDNTSHYSIGRFHTDYRGETAGIFIIPSTDALSFRAGSRSFALIDNLAGDIGSSSTNGLVNFFSQGLLDTVQNTLVSTRVPVIQRTVVTQTQTVSAKTGNYDAVVGSYGQDPLAETFFVDERTHPQGIMMTGLRLLFKTVDPTIPLQIQLRPVNNSYPDSAIVVPGSDIVLNGADCNTVDEVTLGAAYAAGLNPFDDATMYTEAEFDHPVFLQGGVEYCVVLIANTIKYQVYISEMGKAIIGTSRLISSQPFMGSFFTSQNGNTWTPDQNRDLAFRLLYAKFNNTVTANIELQLSVGNSIGANVPIDTFFVASGNMVLPNTTIDATVATTTALGTREPAKPLQLDQNIYFDDLLGRRVATSDTTTFKVNLLLSSQSSDISPVVDLDRMSLYAIENQVNTLGLSNNLVVVTSSSNNWFNAANLSLTITGGGGSGANAYIANTQIDSNNHILANVVVDAAGSGYTTAPTITLSGNSALSATIVAAGEDHPFGGPSVSRYITRMVTLADGMDAGDFRVFLSAYWPISADIEVYYKILSADDPSPFDSRNYQLMTVITGYGNVSKNSNDILSYVFAPGVNNIKADRIQYGSFVTFKYFAIKVVLSSSDTTKVPRVSNFRVMAFPAEY